MLPGWATEPLEADPIGLELPVAYRAYFGDALARYPHDWPMESRHYGSTAVGGLAGGQTFPWAIYLEMSEVFGVVLLDAFDWPGTFCPPATPRSGSVPVIAPRPDCASATGRQYSGEIPFIWVRPVYTPPPEGDV